MTLIWYVIFLPSLVILEDELKVSLATGMILVAMVAGAGGDQTVGEKDAGTRGTV